MKVYSLKTPESQWPLEDIKNDIESGKYALVRLIREMHIGMGLVAYVISYRSVGRSINYDFSKSNSEQRPHMAFEVCFSNRLECDAKALKRELLEMDAKIVSELSVLDALPLALPVEQGKRKSKYSPVEYYKRKPLRVPAVGNFQFIQFSPSDQKAWSHAVMWTMPKVYTDIIQVPLMMVSPISDTEYDSLVKSHIKEKLPEDDKAHEMW